MSVLNGEGEEPVVCGSDRNSQGTSVAVFAPRLARAHGFGTNVSAHAQIPIMASKMLRACGCVVDFLTLGTVPGDTMPEMLGDIHLHDMTIRTRFPFNGSRPCRYALLPAEFHSLRKIMVDHQYDVVHFFGSQRLAYIAGLLSLAGVKSRMVLSLMFPPTIGRASSCEILLWKRIHAVTTATDYVASICAVKGVRSTVVRHGIVHDLPAQVRRARHACPRSIVFIRSGYAENGFDTAIDAFDRLAGMYPGLGFVFAVRELHESFRMPLQRILRAHANVFCFEFSRPPSVSLVDVLAGALCTVQPYRQLSCQPQLSVLESLACGIPVITTDIESNPEIVQNGVNGLLVPASDVRALIEAVEMLIADEKGRLNMAAEARRHIEESWNWNMYADTMLSIYRAQNFAPAIGTP